jgi:glutathione S-transferase
MTLQLFGHPFSSYTQKALIALYENGTPFEFRMLSPDEPANGAEFRPAVASQTLSHPGRQGADHP